MLVPAELVAHIFSFLQGERSALEECSKAHPMFSRLAEPYLYAHILIHNENALSELYKQLSENPHILNFPRTLEILRADPSLILTPPEPEVLFLMSVIPQMTNLVSLSLEEQWSEGFYGNFLSTFRTCLRQSAIEELCLKGFVDFPFSILDHGRNIKKLKLFECTAMSEDEPISASGSPHQSLETFIIGFYHDPVILLWVTHRAISLTTLELQGSLYPHCTEFAGLLQACSNSLTKLHLDIGTQYQSIFRKDRYSYDGHWDNDHLAFPFTLSAHTCLRELSILARVRSYPMATHCALPAILRLIKTALSIPDVILRFKRSQRSNPDTHSFNLSPLLDRARSDFPASVKIRPRIDLHVDDAWATPYDINSYARSSSCHRL